MRTIIARGAGRRAGWLLAGASIALLQLGQPAFAGDPFRPSTPRNISETSEQAFYAMFREGNYVEARQYLESADPEASSDPMYHAMSAAFAYLDEDWEGLLTKAELTQETAIAIESADPLRGHLYQAVGIFLEGAHVLQTQGVARGTPRALAMLQDVFDHMDAAEAINAEDPELNLLKGYMDLLLAVNLPFAQAEPAIERLSTYGYPAYVAYRGIALGYRDLDRNPEALEAVNVALEEAPENPDLLYLKAQLLTRLDRHQESLEYFDQALAYADQLPLSTTLQIALERCQADGGRRSICKDQIQDEYGS